jgi:hypothetical protein
MSAAKWQNIAGSKKFFTLPSKKKSNKKSKGTLYR